MLARIIDGRRLRRRIKIEDYPALEAVASVIATQSANIVETLHNRPHYGVAMSETARRYHPRNAWAQDHVA